jgi:hypothetical protein
VAVIAARVTVSTTAVALITPSTAGQTAVIKNTDATNAADIGTSAVTAGTGFPLAAGASITIEVDAGDVLYAIRSAAADVVLAVLQT